MTLSNRPHRTGPVSMLVSYYPKEGHESAILELVKKHWPTLRELGLVTERPAQVWTATDTGKGRRYVVELFEWKDEQSSDVAHQTPEVMAIWEPMGPILDELQLTEIEPVV